jgi:pimeloyl-ACP methyl ester carboxylesterase
MAAARTTSQPLNQFVAQFMAQRGGRRQHSRSAEKAYGEILRSGDQRPFAKIESHYFANLGFFNGDNEILNSVQGLRDVPIRIVQGRYDLVCPMESAWLPHQALPGSELVIVDAAGHSALDDPITGRLVAAANDFKLIS